jgi:hypothetical protein
VRYPPMLPRALSCPELSLTTLTGASAAVGRHWPFVLLWRPHSRCLGPFFAPCPCFPPYGEAGKGSGLLVACLR